MMCDSHREIQERKDLDGRKVNAFDSYLPMEGNIALSAEIHLV